MTKNISPTTTHTLVVISIRFSLAIILLFITLSAASAQTTSPRDGSTPLGLQAGAPAGSYSLSDFDNINLYNGSLNFRLPLLSIGGRGNSGHTILLPIEQHWMVEHYEDDQQNFANYPVPLRTDELNINYGPGMMSARFGGSRWAVACPTPSPGFEDDGPEYRHHSTITRLVFTASDGTETIFVDTLTGGQVELTGNSCPVTNFGYDRGKVFASIDGSGATFISDDDIYDWVKAGDLTLTEYAVSGYMMLKDGTRYRIDSGLVSWIRDRNGNKITFTYNGYGLVSTITDSLNRQVTISYDVNDGSPYGVCDKITYKGYGGATRVVRISKTTLSNVLRSGYSLTTYAYLFPGLQGSNSSYYNPTVVSSVWLPDSDSVTRRYQFQYNNYGELARVVLPTGGAYEYDYAAGTTDATTEGVVDQYSFNPQIYRRVVERRVYPDGASGSSYTSKSTYSVPETYNTSSTLGYVTVEERDVSNNLFAKSKHYFNGPGAAPTLWKDPTELSPLTDGKEYKTEALSIDGNNTVLRRTEHTWNEATTFGEGPYISQTVTTLEPSGANLVSKQTFSWDRYNNQTDIYEYDYGSGSAGSLVRHTATTYITTNNSYDYACSPSSTCNSSASMSNVIHIRSLPTQISVYDSGGTERARTTFEYDNYASDTTHAGLVSRSSISGLDSSFTTSNTKRGNLTATTRYLLNSSGSVTGSISAYAQFDIAGNTVKTIDARGNATTIDFTDRFGSPNGDAEANSAPSELSTPGQYSYALATKVTNALNQSAYVQFDYYLGKPVDAEDANGIVASGYYDDVLDRPTQVRRAVGVSGAQNQTTFAYDDANRTVTATSDLSSNNDNSLVSKTLYDQMGRVVESREYEGGTNYIVTKRDYDSIGRAYRISNPYRPWNSESAAWTTNTYDALGRTVSTTTADSAVVTTSYSGNTVTATDQAGKSRKSVTDALGRMTAVYEDPSSLNYQTSYSFDVLDDLTQVSQGSQTRTFVYDSLKRLTSATNPESGTVTTVYDDNGNVLVSTDARGVSVHVSYDELNRPTRRWYNGSSSTSSTTNGSPSLPSGVAATDEVAYFYDSQTLPSGAPSFTRGYSTGALVAVTYGGGSAGTYRGYDALGRIVRQYQQTDSVNYLVEASYSVGTLSSETYPSVPGASDRRTVSFSYDSAGRLSSLSSSATTYAPAASMSSIGYASHNGLSTETCGNSLIHAVTYNNRLQPTEIKLGTSGSPTSVVDLSYSYGTTSNNGNVQSVSYAGGGLSYTQSFTYDSLNRLSTATETSGGSTSWTQTEGYDRYGNRWVDLGSGLQSHYFSTSTNRITNSGYSYDSSGNLTGDGTNSYTYDAEGKIKAVNGTTAYTYDGEGHRVRKLVGENTRFIYGIGEQLVAEYDGSSSNLKKEYVLGGATLITIEPTAVNSNGTQYTTSDHAGSPRVITNSSGSVVSRHDYMPFGEELSASTGGRTTGMGFSNSGDNNRKKFTGYERDSETGLDFAQARYYSSTQGRFTSPDPFSGSAKVADPQSLNRYAYVTNNPVRSVDPSGLAGIAAMRSDNDDQSGREGAWQAGQEVIAEEYARYEQQVRDAFSGIQQYEIVSVMISEPADSGGSQQQTQTQTNQTPTDVTMDTPPLTTHVNDPMSQYVLGTGVYSMFQIFVKDQNGQLIPNLVGLESVSPATTQQNPEPQVFSNGIVRDFVGPGSATPSSQPFSSQENNYILRKALLEPRSVTQNHWMLVISPSSAVAAIITHSRSYTNVDAQGRVRPVAVNPITGIPMSNYTLSVSKPRLTQVPIVFCPNIVF